mgnify:CR=1 FL=1
MARAAWFLTDLLGTIDAASDLTFAILTAHRKVAPASTSARSLIFSGLRYTS